MKNNDQALHAFMDKIAQANTLLEELKAYTDNHMEESPEDINWGHVGSVEHMVARLTELTDWAFQRGECAE